LLLQALNVTKVAHCTIAECLSNLWTPFGLAGQLDPEQGRPWLERAAAQGVPEAEPEVAALAGNAATVADELEYLGRALRRLRTGSEQARPVDWREKC
jgi:hypothetical protein